MQILVEGDNMIIIVEKENNGQETTYSINSSIKTDEKINKEISLKLLDLVAEYDTIKSASVKINCSDPTLETEEARDITA